MGSRSRFQRSFLRQMGQKWRGWRSVSGDAVGAVHIAGVGGAVLEGEDVAGFVRGDVHGAAEALAEGGIALGWIAVAVNGPDAEAFPGLGLAEDVVVGRAGEEVTGGEAQIGEGVVGAVGFEQLVEDVERADLVSAPLGMNAAGVVGDDVERQFAVDFDGRLKEVAQVLLRDVEDRSLLRREVAEEDDVDRAIVGGTARRLDLPVFDEGLAGFGMGFEPVVVLEFGEWCGEGPEGLFDVWERKAGRFAGSAGGGKGSESGKQ